MADNPKYHLDKEFI